MQTQVQCPQCGTPFSTEIHQLVDVDQTPELKQQLLSGQVNVAVCPNCGAGGQLTTPMVYHDSDHELFMIHIPQEININQMEREQMIGRMTRQVVDNLPADKRKAYLFQPQTILNMQTFMEKVLETEGITKEMIDRQRNQAELMTTLMRADREVVDHLLTERANEIDETFFAMLQNFMDTAQQMQNDNEVVKLTNLRARLMTETAAGREMEKVQIAMHHFNQAAKKQEGVSPALLLEHLLKNLESRAVMDRLIMAGQGALTYEFFTLLTQEIEQLEKGGDQGKLGQLQALRTELLDIQSKMQAESQRLIEGATETLQQILAAPDRQQAVREHMGEVDDAFMYILSATIAQATQQEDDGQLQALTEVQTLIINEIESQYPPEVILLNQLLEAETPAARETLLDENTHLVQPPLLQMLAAVEKQTEQMGRSELEVPLQEVRDLIQARL